MAFNFKIEKEIAKGHAQNLVKAVGVPLLKRSLLNAQSVQEGDKRDATSLLGTPLYGTLFIEQPVYTDFIYDSNEKTYEEKSIVLSDNKTIAGKKGVYVEGAIIEITQPRNIVTTNISGMDGSVKEFINNGDFNINVKGYFAGSTPDTFPEKDVIAMNQYLKAPVPLTVTNVFLNTYFSISQIVCKSFRFYQEEGIRNIQYFEADFLSDTPFTILEKKG